jgi:Family of unknown function (DUF5709)
MTDESEFTDDASPTEAIAAPQLENAETLLGQDLRSDSLEAGYSPPDYEPKSTRFGTTAEEQRQGETLDQRLAEEEPDVTADDRPPGDFDEIDGVPDARAGRLYAPDEGAHVDEESDAVAYDAGISGGSASAEEAAVHIIGEDDTDF